jgi:hypothetical protein
VPVRSLNLMADSHAGSVEAWFGLALTLLPNPQPSPLSTMKCIGGTGMSGADSERTVPAQEIVVPS